MPMISSGLYGVDKDLVFNSFRKACYDCKNININVYLVMIDKDDYLRYQKL